MRLLHVALPVQRSRKNRMRRGRKGDEAAGAFHAFTA